MLSRVRLMLTFYARRNKRTMNFNDATDVRDQATSWTVLKTYHRANLPDIVLVQGSVLDFACENGCIVNAANEGCLGGGGVDGAITAAGGPALATDRRNLPILSRKRRFEMTDTTISHNERGEAESLENDHRASDDMGDCLTDDDRNGEMFIRCKTGSAVITGPGNYGGLRVPYVIHAVGPDFWDFEGRELEGHALLQSAYTSSLDLAALKNLNEIAFCLLSAGVFRGELKLSTVLSKSLTAIADWKPPVSAETSTGANEASSTMLLGLVKIYVFAFTDRECHVLLRIGQRIFES